MSSRKAVWLGIEQLAPMRFTTLGSNLADHYVGLNRSHEANTQMLLAGHDPDQPCFSRLRRAPQASFDSWRGKRNWARMCMNMSMAFFVDQERRDADRHGDDADAMPPPIWSCGSASGAVSNLLQKSGEIARC